MVTSVPCNQNASQRYYWKRPISWRAVCRLTFSHFLGKESIFWFQIGWVRLQPASPNLFTIWGWASPCLLMLLLCWKTGNCWPDHQLGKPGVPRDWDDPSWNAPRTWSVFLKLLCSNLFRNCRCCAWDDEAWSRQICGNHLWQHHSWTGGQLHNEDLRDA